MIGPTAERRRSDDRRSWAVRIGGVKPLVPTLIEVAVRLPSGAM